MTAFTSILCNTYLVFILYLFNKNLVLLTSHFDFPLHRTKKLRFALITEKSFLKRGVSGHFFHERRNTFIYHTRTIALYHYTLWGNASVLGTPWSRQYTYLMSLSVAVWLYKRLILFILNKVLRDNKTHFSWVLGACVTEFWIVYICLSGDLFMKGAGKLWQKVWTPLSQGKLRNDQKGHKSQVLHLYHSASYLYCNCSQKVKTAWSLIRKTFFATRVSPGRNHLKNAYCISHAV